MVNIVREHFTDFKQLFDPERRPLANVYWTDANPRNDDMCLYLMHGYGGSPIEPCMKLPMEYAKSSGFKVVAIEGADLSATYDIPKDITEMTLERQKQALASALRFCRDIPELRASYNIAWAHSIACRALSDLVVDSPRLRRFFDEVVLNNPYFLPPPKVDALRTRLLGRDPSGATWREFSRRATVQFREIEGHTFKIPTCLHNLFIPIPNTWADVNKTDLTKIAERMGRFISKIYVHFILGTGDNMADYSQNLQFGHGLNIPNKEILLIQGANHSFENALGQYDEFSHIVLDAIKRRGQNQR